MIRPAYGMRFQRFFNKEGFSVLTAIDGEDAVRVLQKHEVGVVVTDLKCPGRWGRAFENCKNHFPDQSR